jgi:hypothetical protein
VRITVIMTPVLLGAIAARADDATPLANDPFLRPGLVELAPAEAVAPPLELRAVLFAGDDSLVDVGGRIVRVGDEVSGYTLVGVSEDGAFFERDGRSLSVPLPEHASGVATADPTLQAKESDDDAG